MTRNTVTLCVLALGASLAALTPAHAADGWTYSSGTLRAGPGTSYPPILRVAAGRPVEVFGCLRGWTWCDVAVAGERGWFPGRRIAFEQSGRRRVLTTIAPALGLGIVVFDRDAYWTSHYRGRAFYDRWDRRHPGRHVEPDRRPGPGVVIDRDHRPAHRDRPVIRHRPPENRPAEPRRVRPERAEPRRHVAPPRRDAAPQRHRQAPPAAHRAPDRPTLRPQN